MERYRRDSVRIISKNGGKAVFRLIVISCSRYLEKIKFRFLSASVKNEIITRLLCSRDFFVGGKVCLFARNNKNINGKAYQYGIKKFDCGICPECLSKKARVWALRAVMQARRTPAVMVTLTYDTYKYDKYGNIIGENEPNRDLRVCKKDVQNFFKRLRAKFPFNDIKYIATAEYGKRTGRAHYHALIFGIQFNDLRFYKKSKRGNVIYKSATLEKVWQGGRGKIRGGICTVDCVNPSASCARYCTKYACKDAGVDDTFMLFSRGIGMEELLENFNGKSYWIDGKEYPIPKQVWQAVIRKKYALSSDYTRYINFPDTITKDRLDGDDLKNAIKKYFRSQAKRERYSYIRDNDTIYKRYLQYWKRKADLNSKYELSATERILQLDSKKYWSYKQKCLSAINRKKFGFGYRLPRSTRFYNTLERKERVIDITFIERVKKFAVTSRHNTANDNKHRQSLVYFKKCGAFLMPDNWREGEKNPF